MVSVAVRMQAGQVSSPVPYLGAKSRYLFLFPKILKDAKVERFVDLTAGGGSVGWYFGRNGAKELLLNDVSVYPQLVARALHEGQVPQRIEERTLAMPIRGWGYEHLTGQFSPPTLAYIDGFCQAHRTEPVFLVAMGAALTRETRFTGWLAEHKTLTGSALREKVEKELRRLRLLVGKAKALTVTSQNYLDLGPPYDQVRGAVVYLDPAWPHPKERKTKNASDAYTFYAVELSSLLLQQSQAAPPQYSVELPEFFAGLARTAKMFLSNGNRFLLAYQAKLVEIDAVIEELTSAGLTEKQRLQATKNPSSTLVEYLSELAL